MDTLVWKLRIASLWIFYAVGISALFVLSLLEPGMIQDIMAGKVEDTTTTVAAVMGVVYILVPAAMVFVTFVLKDTVNRWVNGIAGLFYTATMVPDIIGHFGSILGVFVTVCATVLAGALILWHVWKWPTSAQEPAAHEDRVSVAQPARSGGR